MEKRAHHTERAKMALKRTRASVMQATLEMIVRLTSMIVKHTNALVTAHALMASTRSTANAICVTPVRRVKRQCQNAVKVVSVVQARVHALMLKATTKRSRVLVRVVTPATLAKYPAPTQTAALHLPAGVVQNVQRGRRWSTQVL